MKLRLPKRLQPGDTIGILSTSSPVERELVENTRRYFEARGYRVRLGEHVFDRLGFMAGIPAARVEDFNAMLVDPEVRMIVTATGGCSAVQMLADVHYGALSADPKIVVGISDPSILLCALTAWSGVPAFHGPNGFDFGNGHLSEFTEDNFWPLVTGSIHFPHRFPVEHTLKVLRDGPPVEGWLWGGHTSTIQALVGTPWMPHWNKGILFLEEYQVKLSRMDAMLAHLRLAGVFERIRGLVIGRPVECNEPDVETFEDIILRNCAGYTFPIVTDVLLGHTVDKITLPVGILARLDTTDPCFELLEPAVF